MSNRRREGRTGRTKQDRCGRWWGSAAARTIAATAAIALLIGRGAAALAAGPAVPPRDTAQERAYANMLNDRNLAQAFYDATRLMDQGREADAEAAFRKVAQAAPNHAPTQWRLSAL